MKNLLKSNLLLQRK